MLEPGQVIDRYKVDSLLGQGGMAVVYRVVHEQLGSYHALKVLTISSAGITERLMQEGRVQASLRHPNVVAVTDVIDVEGQPGLVMEYVEGPALDDWLRDHQPDIEQALIVFRSVVAGVSAAHEKGTIHRDLKPANVMLAPASGAYIPKVADFGLAKAVVGDMGGLQQTRSGVTMGTPAYMAPEQIRDAKNVDERADIFSLGCILYELVCGRPPFNGPDILSIFNAVASGEYPAAVSLMPDLPSNVQNAIHGCIVVDRDKRIGSCRELLEVLEGSPLRHPDVSITSTQLPGTQPTSPAPIAGGQTWTQDMLEERQYAADSNGEIQSIPATAPGRKVASAPDLSASIRPPTGSLEPGAARKKRSKLWLVPLLLIPMMLLAAALVVMLGSGWFVKNRWEKQTRDLAAAVTGGELTYGAASMRPQALHLADVVLMGADGAPFAEADAVLLTGSWIVSGFSATFEPQEVDVQGLRVDVRREGDGWVLPEQTLALLRGEGEGTVPNLTLAALRTDPVEITVHDDEGTLTTTWSALTLETLTVDPDEPGLLVASVGTMEALSISAGEPLIEAERVSLTSDGAAVLEGAALWLRLTEDGVLDPGPGLSRAIPDWAGGTSRSASDAPWFGLADAHWPLRPERLEFSSGTLHLLDRAHAPKTVRWEIALEHGAIGPLRDGALPIDISGRAQDARVSIEGDIRADGMITGEVRARQLDLEQLAPYFARSLKRYAHKPASGKVGFEVRFTAKQDSFAAQMTAEAEDVAFDRVPRPPDAPSPPRNARKLDKERKRVEASHEVGGSLADPRFEPVEEMLFALEDALMAPAGGAIRPPGEGYTAAARRPARTRPTAAAKPPPPDRTAPTAPTTTDEPPTDPETPADEAEDPDKFPEPTERRRDKFDREVRDALEKLKDIPIGGRKK